MTLEQDRARLSGLHFAQDSMRPHERETVHLAEAMLRRLDLVRDLHRPEPVPEDGFNAGFEMTWCARDHEAWPCATLALLED